MLDPDEVGSRVRLVGMPLDSQLEGCEGVVMKTVGIGRVAVMLDGRDKTTVLSRKNVSRLSLPFRPPAYSIVGTWDDWEAHDMTWRPELSCYDFLLTLNSDSESFKFLEEGNWERCVYPENGLVKGPDDSGLDAEWSISGTAGGRWRVSLSFSAGKPKSVSWEPEQRRRVSFSEQVLREEVLPPVMRAEWEAKSAVKEKEAVQDVERLARERLTRRLEEAEQAELKAIADVRVMEEQKESILQARLAENRRRYMAQCGEEAAEGEGLVAERRGPMVLGACMECGKATGNVLDVGGYCCESCFAGFQEAVRKGWSGCALVQGRQAAQLVQNMVGERGMSVAAARRELMAKHPQCFFKVRA